MDQGSTRRIEHQGGWAHVIEFPTLLVTVVEGPDKRHKVELAVPLVRVGTGNTNDLVLTDDAVSRSHLSIARTDDGLLVRDEGSTNGTFLDGVKVKEAFVQPGSTIRLGGTTLKIEVKTASRLAVSSPDETLGGLVGKSPAMKELYSLLRAVAPSNVSVMIEGETGTGKEVVARALHDLSGRSGEFVAFDCASVSKDLIHSELFGHRGGAYTGAQQERTGACRTADRGTLFIDEIGDLPLPLQATLLRFLERREVKPLGADRPVPVDARVVSATHVDLLGAVTERTFREDLYHRLKVVRIRLPPLRERREDLPMLIEHFSKDLGLRLTFSPEARVLLDHYHWPGNVRELRHALERLSLICRDRPVEVNDLDLQPVPAPVAADGARENLTADAIRKALEAAGGNKGLAAKMLGIGRSTMFRKAKELGLDDGSPDE